MTASNNRPLARYRNGSIFGYLSSVWMFPGGDGETKKERTHV